MKRGYLQVILGALIISVAGVLAIDRTAHLLFSSPMETTAYFLAKMALYFLFSILFLAVLNLKKHEFIKVLVNGIIVASIWGIYYNILPVIFNFSPFGLPLRYLTFLGMGLFGTGVAFGIVHTLAFVGGYYAYKLIFMIVDYYIK